MENGDTGGINVIWDKINEFLQYSMDNIGYIRQEELDRFPETQNELARVRQEIEDLDNVIEQAKLQYENYRSELFESSLGKNGTIAEDEYGRGAHLLKMISSFREKRKELSEQEKVLSSEVERVERLMSTSNDIANRVRLALRILEAKGSEEGSGENGSNEALVNAYKIAEREAITLARDLHDGPAQKLASAVMLVELAERMIRKGETEKALVEFVEIKNQIREALWDTRSFLLRLNPRGLEYGLDLAVKKFIDQMRMVSGTRINLTSKGDLSVLSLPQRSNIYKIIHQAVTNAVRDGDASTVTIFMNASRKKVSLKITDDGNGFDISEARKTANEKGSFGLANMEERTRIAGGRITIDSAPGKGTLISLEIPVNGGL